jgi:hypothetical protein
MKWWKLGMLQEKREMTPFYFRFRSTGRAVTGFLTLFVFIFGARGPGAGPARSAARMAESTAPAPVLQTARPGLADRPWVMQLSPEPQVQELIDQVTPTLVYSYVAGLSGDQPVTISGSPLTIQNRNTHGGEGIQRATQYVYERFSAAGLLASFHYWDEATNPNVIAEQPGGLLPGRVFLITAHLDNLPEREVAPGADDNASGSAGVLVAAEILSGMGCRQTLRYILFTGEEQGLLGSRAYADAVAGDEIRGVLNLDMIGWQSDDHLEVDLYARPWNQADLRIAAFFSGVVEAYGLNLVPEVHEYAESRSDHYSFWRKGFPAILAIEDMEDFNRYYHSPNDRLSHLDIGYLTDFVRASVALLAHIACLAPGEIYLPVVSWPAAGSSVLR